MIVFAIPSFLWGLVACVLPWILRRRLPREIPRVPFAFISFLREVEAQEFLSPRLQEWLLLLLRVLIIVGLVLAAADPVWVSGKWGRSRDQVRAALDARAGEETVLLLDRSASMRRSTDGVTTWQRAVDRAKRLLESDSGRAWALGFWTDGTGMAAPLADQLHRGSAADLVAILDKTDPLDRPSDFQPLVREIGRGAIEGPIVLLTDHQASGWQGLLSGPITDRSPAFPLWVVPLGSKPGSGVWIEVTALSSFPWAVGFDEEIQANVRQWGEPAAVDLLLQLRLEEPDTVVLAEFPCKLDPSPPPDGVVDHPLRLSVRLGKAPDDRRVSPVALVLIAEGGDQSPASRIVGHVPILSGVPLSFVGGGPVLDAVGDCLNTEGLARAFSVTPVTGFEGVPLNHLAVSTLSVLLALPYGVSQAATWIRGGGRCLLFVDRAVDTAAAPGGIDLLFKWEAGESPAQPDGVSVDGEHPIGAAFVDWPKETWQEWRSFIPGYCPAARAIVCFERSGEIRTDIVGELVVGLGRVVFVNVGSSNQMGPLRSPLFPVAVLESLKSLSSERATGLQLRVGSRLEDDVRPLSQSDREALEQTELVDFVGIDQMTRPGAPFASPVRLRSVLLGLVILIGLIELWLANRGVSA